MQKKHEHNLPKKIINYFQINRISLNHVAAKTARRNYFKIFNCVKTAKSSHFLVLYFLS